MPWWSDQVSPREIEIILTKFQAVLDHNVAGDVVELGCYKGRRVWFLARLLKEYSLPKQLWLYDSFQGLPDKSAADDSRLGDSFCPGALKATKAEVARNFAHANLPQPSLKRPGSVTWRRMMCRTRYALPTLMATTMTALGIASGL